MLTLTDVHKRFGQSEVLSGVTAVFAPGTMAAIVGPSGSGKSTLLNILSGHLTPDRGAVFRGCRTDEISLVMQSSDGLRSRTVCDNVVAPLLRRMPRQQAVEIAIEALDALGMKHFAQRTFRDLSGGEAQRTAVARAVACRARVILADEPSGQLDASNTLVVVDALHRAAALGSTVVVVTHDPEVAAACAQVLRIVNGRVTEDGELAVR